MALAESLEKVYKLPMGTLAQAITPQPVARAAERVGPILQERFSVMPQGQMTNEETAIMEIAKEAEMSTDPEEKEGLMSMIEKLQAQAIAPMGSVAQELAAMGGGEDTALAHVRPGEVVVPPEIVQDPEVESLLESKFNQMGINPEEAVVGVGIASLNPNTGLEQFGFFKKIGKKLGKVVKKVAPIAAFIPGVGTALGGVLGGIGGLATKIPGIGGALGKVGSTIAGGIAKAGIPGISSIAGGTSGGFGGIMDALTTKSGLLGGGMFGQTGSSFLGGPEAGKGLANRLGLGSGTAGQVEAFQKAQRAQAFLDNLPPEQLANMDPAQLELIKQTAAGGSGTGIGSNIRSIFGGGSGGIGGILGGGASTGGGGFGDMLKMGGIGALAAGLGKLAYDEAKDQRGVPLTPLTTMDATGRYNIEAEIARRMGQPAPNPVEFGLLPEGTLPELSGGKPRGMQEGGSVDKMRNLAMRAGQANNTLTELESTFNPNNLMDVVASNLPFDPTAVENLLMSAEKKQYDQAKSDFMSAILRQETGAVITEDEIEWMNKTYFPQLGDDDDVIALKRRARQQAVDGFSSMIPKKTQDKSTGSMPMMMYGGPVMAYAEGGNVAMEDFKRMNGRIDGPGTETSDDIPAMLSDGEFVMTGRAVRGAGSFDMQNSNGIVTLTPNGSPDRESGTNLMYQLMEVFSGQARPST